VLSKVMVVALVNNVFAKFVNFLGMMTIDSAYCGGYCSVHSCSKENIWVEIKSNQPMIPFYCGRVVKGMHPCHGECHHNSRGSCHKVDSVTPLLMGSWSMHAWITVVVKVN